MNKGKFIFFIFATFISQTVFASYTIQYPNPTLLKDQLVVVANTKDFLSKKIANLYIKKHDISADNLIYVSFNPRKTELSIKDFERILKRVRRESPENTKAYLLTWAQPYRVGCMSITSAFAFGYNKAFCSARTCAHTRKNPYYGAQSSRFWNDDHFRPTMMLAAKTIADAKALIDRGVLSIDTWPKGKAYLVKTQDKARNVRYHLFAQVKTVLGGLIPIETLNTNGIANKKDIMFYFTGTAYVPYLNSLRFKPGAIADHLTSFGGQLTNSSQTSAMQWLQAGASGSYGTVVEPCNLLGKFPDPRAVMYFYLRGNPLIEAYWKSVLMPGEGVFIGDPLARPFGGYKVKEEKNDLLLKSYEIIPGMYQIQTAPSTRGPFSNQKEKLIVHNLQFEFRLPKYKNKIIRLKPLEKL